MGRLLQATAATVLLGAAGTAHATGLTSGTVIGVFGGAITSGNVLNSPALGQTTYYNNAGSANYSIANSTDTTTSGGMQTTGSALRWGTSSTGVPADESFSQLTFFGGTIPSNVHAPFQLGTITYLNGTSDLDTLIFGATISFYDNVVSSATYLGSDTLYINTTYNLNASPQQDADWINVCGPSSNICNSRLEAIEDSEGGSGVTANLTGRVVGDPTLQINGIALAPNQTTTGNGFIGTGPQLAVPEPMSLALLGGGVAGLGVLRGARGRRVRRRSGSTRSGSAPI